MRRAQTPELFAKGDSLTQLQACTGCCVFALELSHVVSGRLNLGDGANALATAPNVFPGFGLVATKVHLAGVTLGQVLRVESGVTNAWRQIVAVDAGKQVAVDNVVRIGIDDGLLVGLRRARLLRCDEASANVGKVGTGSLRGQHGITRGNRTA